MSDIDFAGNADFTSSRTKMVGNERADDCPHGKYIWCMACAPAKGRARRCKAFEMFSMLTCHGFLNHCDGADSAFY